MFYVYAHCRPDGSVFYVGKGSGDRLRKSGNRNQRWKRIAAKHKWHPAKLADGLTEDQAYEIEISMIAHFKAIGMCEANFSIGGRGVTVERRWWGKKISKSLTGAKGKSGKDNKSFKDFATKEQLIRDYAEMGTIAIGEKYGVSYATVCARLSQFGISLRNAGRKRTPIKCVNDGMVFASLSEAAAHYSIFRENIRKVLAGTYQNTGGRKFVKV